MFKEYANNNIARGSISRINSVFKSIKNTINKLIARAI
jgi:hypothetical protein